MAKMLNFHDEFAIFDNNIKLTEGRKDKIRRSRDAVRDKVRNYFSDTLNISKPKFRIQGSFIINTALNPLPEEEVDADDGVYLTHVNEEDSSTWPKPSDVHKDIMDALEDHTQDGTESKTSCVRVQYRNIYHLDLPVYIMNGDEALLGQTSSESWIKSDAKAFKDWFYENRFNDQTSRIIRCLKAWRDYTNAPFTSIELTIEGINCFSANKDNDHIAFYETVKNIYYKLNANRRISKPVSPYENLWEGITESEKDKKIEAFSIFKEDLKSALENNSNTRASSILSEIFGDRFPWKKDKKEESLIEYSIGAKPWGMC